MIAAIRKFFNRKQEAKDLMWKRLKGELPERPDLEHFITKILDEEVSDEEAQKFIADYIDYKLKESNRMHDEENK